MVKCALKGINGKWIFIDPEDVMKIEPTSKKNQTKITCLDDSELLVKGNATQNENFLESARDEK